MKRKGTRTTWTARLVAAAALVLGTAWSAHAQAVLCPRTYFFNDPETVVTDINSHHYVFHFTLEFGETFSPFVGSARYDFGIVVSNDLRASLLDTYMLTSCYRYLIPIPPYAEPQPVILVVETDWGYRDIHLNFTPPADESEDCYWAEERVDAHPVKPTPGERPHSMTVDCSGGGGSGGGGGTLTVYCLYYDYYDGDGNFLYEELQYCWEEET